METTDNWRERRELLLKKAKVYDRLEPLIAAAHANQLSLAVFKPAKILDFVWETDDREWDQSKVDQMRSNADQAELFAGDSWRQTFKLMPKLPFKFSYRFEDAAGKQSEMRVLDWEPASYSGTAAVPPTATNGWRWRKSARNTWTSS